MRSVTALFLLTLLHFLANKEQFERVDLEDHLYRNGCGKLVLISFV